MVLQYISWTFSYDIEGWLNIIDFSNGKNPNHKYTIKPKYLLADNFDPYLDGPDHVHHTRINMNRVVNNLIYYAIIETTSKIDGKKTYKIILTGSQAKLTSELKYFMTDNVLQKDYNDFTEIDVLIKVLKKNNSCNYTGLNGDTIMILMKTKDLNGL